MRKVLHIVSTIDIGSGVMSFIMNYYRYIDRDKVQFAFLYWDDGKINYKNEILSLGGNLYKINKPNLSMSSVKEINYVFKNLSYEYDVIHLHEVYLNILIFIFSKKYNIKHIIVHAHATKYSDKLISAVRNYILCLPIKFTCNYFLACSNDAAKFLYGEKNLKNLFVIKNAIDYRRFYYNEENRNAIRKKLCISDDEFIFGNIGRFSEQKNHLFLIDIFLELLKINDKFKLLLIGNGDLKNIILEKIELNNIKDKVIILENTNEVDKILNVMDMFILPSKFEGLGIVAIEAQVNGLKCVVSDEVPKETRISENIVYIDLNKNIKYWTNSILDLVNRSDIRNNVSNLDYSFDITRNVKYLEDFYINL